MTEVLNSERDSGNSSNEGPNKRQKKSMKAKNSSNEKLKNWSKILKNPDKYKNWS
jgi:hypothetical protein